GRPDVLLGIRPRGARESLSVFDSASKSSFAYSKTRDKGTGVKKEHLDRIRSMLRLNKLLVDNKEPDAGSGAAGDSSAPSTEGSDPVSDALDLLNKTRR
ncbi:hypothetical protein LPJ71_010987, partial [Coemansia sp. S17]